MEVGDSWSGMLVRRRGVMWLADEDDRKCNTGLQGALLVLDIRIDVLDGVARLCDKSIVPFSNPPGYTLRGLRNMGGKTRKRTMFRSPRKV
jgi:hypothetical protein